MNITIPGESFLTEGLQLIKRGISSDLFKYVKPLERVSFIETFENPSPKKEEPKLQDTRAFLPEPKETAKVKEPTKKTPKPKGRYPERVGDQRLGLIR